MSTFHFANYDFDIDEERSFWLIKNGMLTVEIRGKDNRVNDIDDDSVVSSLLYAPYFYARGLPTNGACQIDITEEILDEYDVAMYAHEHYDVLPCSICLNSDGLKIIGVMEKGGFSHPIKFDINDKRTSLNMEKLNG